MRFLILLSLLAATAFSTPILIYGHGSTLAQALYQTTWSSAFLTSTSGQVNITYNLESSAAYRNLSSFGSGSAIKALAYGLADFGDSDIPLQPADYATFASVGVPAPLQFPIALTGVSVAYNIPSQYITGTLNLTALNIAKIFNGVITTWSDPALLADNPNLNYPATISLAFRSDNSGTTDVFTKFLATANPGVWPFMNSESPSTAWNATLYAAAKTASGNGNLAVVVENNPGTISYLNYGTAASYNYISSAVLQNADGYWIQESLSAFTAAANVAAPSLPTTASSSAWQNYSLVWQHGAQSYPIVTFTFLMVPAVQSGAKGAALANFIIWTASNYAQTIGADNDFAPTGTTIENIVKTGVLSIQVTFGRTYCDSYNTGDSECNSPTYIQPAVNFTFYGHGSTLAQALYQNTWAAGFGTAANGRAGLTYNLQSSKAYQTIGSFGSGSAIEALSMNITDFGDSDIPLQAADYATFQAAEYPIPLQFPIGLTGVSVGYNIPAASITGTLNLTEINVALIFSGQITWWNDSRILQYNPGLTYAQPITLLFRSDNSGTTDVFTKYLGTAAPTYWSLANSETPANAWPPALYNTAKTNGHVASGNTNLVTLLNSVAGGISYINFGTAATQPEVNSAVLRNQAGNWVAESLAGFTAAANAASGTLPTSVLSNWSDYTLVWQSGANTYPIATFTFFMIFQYQPGAKGAAIANFLYWVTTNTAQSISANNDFAPLPANVINTIQTGIARIQLDSQYSSYCTYFSDGNALCSQTPQRVSAPTSGPSSGPTSGPSSSPTNAPSSASTATPVALLLVALVFSVLLL